MKRKVLSLLLSLILLFSSAACSAPGSSGRGEETTSAPPPEVLRGMVVQALGDGGLISEPEIDEEALRASADAITAFAVENSLNAIFFEATPQGEAAWPSQVLPRSGAFDFSSGLFSHHDPLEILMESAGERGISVYAVLTPYAAGPRSAKPDKKSLLGKNPDAAVAVGDLFYYRPDNADAHAQAVLAAEELCERYPLSGIIIGDVDDSEISDYDGYYTYLAALVSDISDVVSASLGPEAQTGLFLSSKADDAENSASRTAFLEFACYSSVDFIAPDILSDAADGKDSPYYRDLSAYTTLGASYGTTVYTLETVSEETTPNECEDSLFVNNLLGLSGGILSSYATLRDKSGVMDSIIPMLFIEGSIIPEHSFDIPTEFRITRPLDGERLRVDTTWESYYITGTSDPNQPVYCDGEEIERISTNGTFGVLTELDYGTNTFRFTQGTDTLTAEIYRPYPDETTKISTISTYVSSSNPSSAVFQPYGPQVVSEYLPMNFQCNAPAGGKVTANLNGEEYELEQTVDAEEGTPVLFRKEVKLPAGDPDEVVSLGKVTYTLDYQDEISEVEAPGEVYLVGSNRRAIFRVKEGIGTVLNPSMQSGDFMTTLKPGSTGEIVGQTTNYFETSFGGFIQKKETEIVTDLESAQNQVSSIEYLPADEKGDEKLVLHGSLPPCFVVDDASDGNFSIRLFETYGVPDGAVAAESRFFSAIRADNGSDGELTLSFDGSGESYFGYNVSYDGNDTILSFKAKPQISDVKGRPLSGLTIVVDPGHGAQDVGALGVPGITGPMEKNVNMVAAHMAGKLLEGLGADVRMTRENDDEFLELSDRVRFTEEADADFFISVHHNSAIETIDPARVEGTWVYYYNDISGDIADIFLKNICEASGRRELGTENAYYVVCRNTLAPSVLLELGFVPNPKEYEEICNDQNMLDIAHAIADSVVEYVRSLSE